MRDFVLDCSMAVAWFFKDEADEHSNNILEYLANNQAWVPELWPFEIANAFMVAEKRKRINHSTLTKSMAELKKLSIKIDREDHDISTLISFAKAQNLSSYDAAYLDLAIRKNLPLASKDEELMRAAKKCHVHLLTHK